MTIDQSNKMKAFCIAWITKVVAKRKDYRDRLISAIEDIFPESEDDDGYSILRCQNWDFGESSGDIWNRNESLSSRCDFFFSKWRVSECSPFYYLSDKACNDLTCTIRIACDLVIEQSGGVIGYTVGDLRAVFDGVIPDEIMGEHKEEILKANDSDPIWL